MINILLNYLIIKGFVVISPKLTFNLLLQMMSYIFLQEFATQVADNVLSTPPAATEEASLGLWDLAVKGGPLMIVLGALSLIAIYIFAERWWSIRSASRIDMNFMNNIKNYIYSSKTHAAVDLCDRTDTPVSHLIKKGIERMGRPLNDIQTAVENVGTLEIAKLERGLPMLAAIAGGAPMIGFLGTVIGMIQAFYTMAQAGSNIDVSLLSGGIYVAMVTTVGGLVVGIFAYFAYNYLTARISSVLFKMESNTIEFMDLLNEPVRN